jgi:hypothetical protein
MDLGFRMWGLGQRLHGHHPPGHFLEYHPEWPLYLLPGSHSARNPRAAHERVGCLSEGDSRDRGARGGSSIHHTGAIRILLPSIGYPLHPKLNPYLRTTTLNPEP